MENPALPAIRRIGGGALGVRGALRQAIKAFVETLTGVKIEKEIDAGDALATGDKP
jgi:hypothetical protein